MDAETIDMLSALIISEQHPTSYDLDIRWASHSHLNLLNRAFCKVEVAWAKRFNERRNVA